MSDLQPSLIETEDDPIPGTHLHRRRQGGRNICPEYLGSAQNELIAIREASEHGIGAVMFAAAAMCGSGAPGIC